MQCVDVVLVLGHPHGDLDAGDGRLRCAADIEIEKMDGEIAGILDAGGRLKGEDGRALGGLKDVPEQPSIRGAAKGAEALPSSWGGEADLREFQRADHKVGCGFVDVASDRAVPALQFPQIFQVPPAGPLEGLRIRRVLCSPKLQGAVAEGNRAWNRRSVYQQGLPFGCIAQQGHIALGHRPAMRGIELIFGEDAGINRNLRRNPRSRDKRDRADVDEGEDDLLMAVRHELRSINGEDGRPSKAWRA